MRQPEHGAVRLSTTLLAVLLAGLALTVGFAPRSGAAAVAWSPPSRAEPTGLPAGDDSLYGVSCPSTQRCVAVDETGSALTWSPGGWSAPQPAHGGGTLTSVSCPTTRFCVATSAAGSASTFNGKTWGRAQIVGAQATYQVSCPTVRFCGAVGASGYPGQPSIVGTFDGSAWGSSATRSTGTAQDRLLGVSCPSVGRCTAINHDGQVLILRSGQWTPQPHRIEPGGTSISCPTASFCVAVGTGLKAGLRVGTKILPAWYATETAGRWSTARAIPGLGSGLFLSVACPTATQCVTIGLNGKASEWDNGTWTPPTTVFPGGYLGTVALACPAVSWCMAVNSKGQASRLS